MVWREWYTDDGKVAGLFRDDNCRRVDVGRHLDGWGVVAFNSQGREIVIQGGFASEQEARSFDFDHWLRDRSGPAEPKREQAEPERER